MRPPYHIQTRSLTRNTCWKGSSCLGASNWDQLQASRIQKVERGPLFWWFHLLSRYSLVFVKFYVQESHIQLSWASLPKEAKVPDTFGARPSFLLEALLCLASTCLANILTFDSCQTSPTSSILLKTSIVTIHSFFHMAQRPAINKQTDGKATMQLSW